MGRKDEGRALIAAMGSESPRVKFAAAKRALALSARRPGALYPSFDAFVEKLDDPNRILQWTAVRVLGNLAAADSRRKVPALLPRFRRLLRRGELVLTNNTVIALGEVARHAPRMRKAVLAELLRVEGYPHATPECKAISMGRVIDALSGYGAGELRSLRVRAFVTRQAMSRRASTRRKAQALLARMGGPQTASHQGLRRRPA